MPAIPAPRAAEAGEARRRRQAAGAGTYEQSNAVLEQAKHNYVAQEYKVNIELVSCTYIDQDKEHVERKQKNERRALT